MKIRLIMILFIFSASVCVSGQKIGDFEYHKDEVSPAEKAIRSETQFNGYTRYWHNTYHEWYRYGNLFKIARPKVEETIMQNKVDMAEDMGIPGLLMEEGFMNGLLTGSYEVIDQPVPNQLEGALSEGDVLAFVDPGSEVGKMLCSNLPGDWEWPRRMKSHQYDDAGLIRADLFQLDHGQSKLFVVSSPDEGTRQALKEIIDNTGRIVNRYNLHKGWFGAETLLKSVTCTTGHPLEVIGTGMNEGNSWFVFTGYMDFLAKDELNEWMQQVNLPVVTDVGFLPIAGCRDYEGLQVQSMFTRESWNDFAREKGGMYSVLSGIPLPTPFITMGTWPLRGIRNRSTMIMFRLLLEQEVLIAIP